MSRVHLLVRPVSMRSARPGWTATFQSVSFRLRITTPGGLAVQVRVTDRFHAFLERLAGPRGWDTRSRAARSRMLKTIGLRSGVIPDFTHSGLVQPA